MGCMHLVGKIIKIQKKLTHITIRYEITKTSVSRQAPSIVREFEPKWQYP